MAKREVGTVKWFNDKKGFGFISREGGDDLFVHFNEIASEGGFKTLKENAKVEFEVIKTEKGEAASKVTTI
ncbi:cold-shock protein [Candidatus Neomarinimicrobiota bacterium]|jgi:CspA family cold shock protein